MAEPDEWQPVAALPSTPPIPAEDEGWQPVQPQTIDSHDPNAQAQVQASGLRRVWDAFTGAAGEAFGDEPIGMSQKDIQWARDAGIFRKDQYGEGVNGVIRAFNEGVLYNGAQVLDGALRGARAGFRGAGAAAFEAGLPRDIAGILGGEYISPGAFGGGPHAPRPSQVMDYARLRMSRDLGVIGPPKPDIMTMKPAEAAAEAAQPAVIDTHQTYAPSLPEGLTIKSGQSSEMGVTFVGQDKSAHEIQIRDESGKTHYRMEVQDVSNSPDTNGLWGIGYVENVSREYSGLAPQLYQAAAKYVEDRGGTLVAGMNTNRFSDAVLAKLKDSGIATDFRLGDRNLMQIHSAPSPADNPLMSGPPSRAAAAERIGDDVLRGPEPEQPNPWRERFEQFVGKIKNDEDAKQLIRDAADQNDEFPAAREGDIPLKHVESLSQAAGVEPGAVDRTGVGRLLKNDNDVRNAMQAMLQSTEDVKSAARDVKADGSEANLMKLQEAMLRRDTWVEQVVGHRAEWGRTGNVIQEFLQRTKEQEGFSQWLKDQGRTPEGLRKIADAMDNLPPDQVPKFLSDANKPTFVDKAWWYWMNALISGPVTHAKYVVANGVFAGYEGAVVTPVAGAIGAARRAVTGSREGVFAGEAGPRLWGLVAGVPDAAIAAAKAFKSGLQTPLPGEVAQGILPKQNVAFASNIQPIPGWFGKIVGIPSRGASGIHSFFNSLGYRASIEAQAYRAAAKEGLSVTDDAFWQRRQQMADNPTPDMMTLANDEGYRLTYISELGPAMKAVANAIRKVPGGRFVMPFLHIPFNILSRAVEGVPGLNFLPAEARADLKGTNGAVKQDMAAARLVVGSAVGVWAMNQVLNDRMTGFGPTDPKDRALWLASGHQPYSIRIGDYWMSFNRFGSIGTMLGLYSNLGEVIPHMKPDSEELTQAVAMTVHSTGRLLEDEVGMQGLAGLMDSINEPERKGTRFVSNFAASWLPFSSAQRQTASAMDPYMRETKGFVDGLRYYIPGQRETLLPKRDWLGQPLTNAGYGFDIPNAPGVSAIIQHRAAEPSALSLEMKAVDLHPAPPQDRIAGVKLTPQLYDHYQATAGVLTKTALEHLIGMPQWQDLPLVVRETAMRRTIDAAHKAGAAAIQMQYPALIEAGVQQKIDHITGASPTARPKKSPASLEGLQ